MTLTVCWSAKGGAGTTLVAAAWALGSTAPSVLVDVDGDLPTMLGLPAPDGQGLGDWFDSQAAPNAVLDLAIAVTSTTQLIPRGPSPIRRRAPRWGELGRWMAGSDVEFVADVGVGDPPAGFLPEVNLPPNGAVPRGHPRARGLLVTRPCYIALSRARGLDVQPDGIVLVEEPGRDLTARDVARTLRAPVIARVPFDPAIGRATDRGLLAWKLPSSIVKLPGRAA